MRKFLSYFLVCIYLSVIAVNSYASISCDCHHDHSVSVETASTCCSGGEELHLDDTQHNDSQILEEFCLCCSKAPVEVTIETTTTKSDNNRQLQVAELVLVYLTANTKFAEVQLQIERNLRYPPTTYDP